MKDNNPNLVGFSCAYTPLPLIHAAGFTPYRVLPMGDQPDQAGSIMHDNLCPHIKRILDRAMAKDLPELLGMIFMDSCESMRRLADAWQSINSSSRQILVTLPSQTNERGIDYLSRQLRDLSDTLSEWSGNLITTEAIAESMTLYSELAQRIIQLDQKAAAGELSRSKLQKVLNHSVTQPITRTLSELDELENHPSSFNANGRAPIFLFGNVLPDPEAMALFEESGCLILNADICTGTRQHISYDFDETKGPYVQLAHSTLGRPPCARTISLDDPGELVNQVLESTQNTGAKGVIAHVMKFCDPYLTRIPPVLAALKENNLPYLVLEGDCTLRSFGQHRTRIEAFAEMLV